MHTVLIIAVLLIAAVSLFGRGVVRSSLAATFIALLSLAVLFGILIGLSVLTGFAPGDIFVACCIACIVIGLGLTALQHRPRVS